jgi:hypothetical protein
MKKILTLKKFMTPMVVLVMLFISKEGFTQPDYPFQEALLLQVLP